MFSAEFAARARLTPAAFTRRRDLPLPQLVGLLLNLRKGSLQDEVNGCWEVLTGQPLASGVSAAAVCKARQKLDPWALWGLNERLVAAFAQAFPLRRWHGLRVLAADGSTRRMPLTPDVIAHFGRRPRAQQYLWGVFPNSLMCLMAWWWTPNSTLMPSGSGYWPVNIGRRRHRRT